jgi:hypothetical protein
MLVSEQETIHVPRTTMLYDEEKGTKARRLRRLTNPPFSIGREWLTSWSSLQSAGDWRRQFKGALPPCRRPHELVDCFRITHASASQLQMHEDSGYRLSDEVRWK